MKNEAVGKMDTPFSYSHFLSMFTQYIFIIDIYRHRLTICAQCTIDIENIGIVDDEIIIIFY